MCRSLTNTPPPSRRRSPSSLPPTSPSLLSPVPAVVPISSLPLGATFPTLLRSHSLTVTAVAGGRGLHSLNHIKVSAVSQIFKSEDLVIFSVDGFFRCDCSAPPRNPSSTVVAALSETSEVLKSNGFKVMAAFLDLQFLHQVAVFDSRSALTVFAPVDRGMMPLLLAEPSRYNLSAMLRHHMVLWRRLSFTELVSLEEGSLRMTSDLQGRFVINVSRDCDGVLVLNGVLVLFPEIYNNGWLVIHGVGEVLDDQQRSSGST